LLPKTLEKNDIEQGAKLAMNAKIDKNGRLMVKTCHLAVGTQHQA
jgi:uncharacterized lipoprotein YbaY